MNIVKMIYDYCGYTSVKDFSRDTGIQIEQVYKMLRGEKNISIKRLDDILYELDLKIKFERVNNDCVT